MAYKQSPGRMNMPKTGRGVVTVALMTGTPAPLYQKTDALDGDEVPNYNETKGISAPSTATTTSSNKTYKETYGPAQEKKYGSFANYTAAADEWNANNPKKPTPSTTTTSETKNIKIGENTPNSVQTTAVNTLQNTKNKLVATTEARELARKKDSVEDANKLIKRRAIKNGKLTEKDMADAQAAGDRAAILKGVIANKQGNLGRSNESIMDIVKSISEKPSLD
jgi:hypothetical protein